MSRGTIVAYSSLTRKCTKFGLFCIAGDSGGTRKKRHYGHSNCGLVSRFSESLVRIAASLDQAVQLNPQLVASPHVHQPRINGDDNKLSLARCNAQRRPCILGHSAEHGCEPLFSRMRVANHCPHAPVLVRPIRKHGGRPLRRFRRREYRLAHLWRESRSLRR